MALLIGTREFKDFFRSASEAALVPGHLQFWRTYKALFSDKPTEGLGMVINRKKQFDSLQDMVPLIQDYKQQVREERGDSEIKEVLKNIAELKQKKARTENPKERLELADELKALRKKIPSFKMRNSLDGVVARNGFNPEKFRELLRRTGARQ